jgi:CubicO group peptidase (beta-lactamase class C family)
LQNGNWQGQQITPTNWISKSTQPLENGFDGPFGFHWWILEKYNGYYANGHGGQRVWILPDQNMVIVHLAEPSTDQTNLNEVRVLLDLIMEAI